MPKRYNRQPSTIIEDEQEDVEDDELLSTDEEQTVRSDRDAEPQKRKRMAQNNGAESELLNQSNSQVDEPAINALREQLRSTINQIYYLKGTMNELVVEVTHLKQTVLDLKNTVEKELQHSKEQKFSSPSLQPTSTTRESEGPGESHIPAKFVSIQGPFPKYTQRDRILPRPSAKQVAETLGGKEHSLQFTSHLYVDLIEKVLGPQEENLHLDYKAMVKEAIMITKAVVSHMKEAYRIDPELRWSYIDPTVKLETYRILESATEHLLPLKVCLEHWGAHVLISNFWVKRKKYNKKSTTRNSSSSPPRKPGISPFSIPFLTNQSEQ